MSTLRALWLYLRVYGSAPPILIGWLAGLVWHRMRDGWGLARVQLDKLDDAVIEDMERRNREQTR